MRVKGGGKVAVKQSQRAAADKWDAAHMVYQTVKVKKTLRDDFKAACAARGDKVNTVLREAMENYVEEYNASIDKAQAEREQA